VLNADAHAALAEETKALLLDVLLVDDLLVLPQAAISSGSETIPKAKALGLSATDFMKMLL
jgi:hypothetical protein